MFQHTIQSRDKFFNLRFKEIYRYRDLLVLFVHRDFIAKYKQTVLGPLWFLIRPLFQTLILAIVFSGMAKLSTENVPPILFYLAGVTPWNYFANCLKTTSSTFTSNATLFGKVYFPRVITPLSVVISNLIQFLIGLLLFGVVFFYYLFSGADLYPNITLLLLPVLVLLMGFMGLGLGMIISALTIKYRDLQYLVEFGIQLAMYATPVILPLSAVPEKYRFIMVINPMTSVVETFKFSFFGEGTLSISLLIYTVTFTSIVFISGILIFNKTEKNFMDTV